MKIRAGDILAAGAEKLGLALDSDALERLAIYCAELDRWKKKINLVSRQAGQQEILELHFLDSLTVLPLFDASGPGRLLDIGSGAGFPGLVLAAARPKADVLLAEPREKRALFLRHVVRSLGLDSVRVETRRIEELRPENCGHFDLVTARAVSSTGWLLEAAAPFLAPAAAVVRMLGGSADAAAPDDSPGTAGHLYALPQRTTAITLPFSGALRRLLVYRFLPARP